MRIALFGGSFDPPHWGHVLAATYAYVSGRVDAVWVMPVDQHAYAKPLASWDRRWQLCEAAFQGLAFVTVRDDERSNQGGYTFNLVTRLRAERPDVEWCLVGGSDTVEDMRRWHRGAELARLVEVIVVPRRGYDDHPAALPEISSSAIRDLLAAGGAVQDLMPPRVWELIATNGWYR
ncbi:MAG: nicotinate-nicotinamide nucleotide adenylyltransferase [Planctomycetes bacterium]|nr:nicotinate-nicotinamide nucleotide adenylyltransferase [Planctomycetota bacterium]